MRALPPHVESYSTGGNIGPDKRDQTDVWWA
jgi:hypothetical protein